MKIRRPKITSLCSYRKLQRASYLKRYKELLEMFTLDFMRKELPNSLSKIEDHFVLFVDLRTSMQPVDDYMAYRECLHRSLRYVVGKKVLLRASKQSWFDSKWIDEDTLIDLCLSHFVLGKHSQTC